MNYLVFDFFQLVPEVFFKLIPDIINKGLKTSKILTKKNFKFKLYDKRSIFMAALMLSSSKINRAIKKCSNKKSIIYFYYV